MKFKTNLAYNKTAIKHRRQNILTERKHIGRIYRNKTRVMLKFYLFSIVAATVFLSIFILNLVKSTEITANLNSTKKEIQIQSSENVRLKTQLEQEMGIQKIEQYAKKNLGMTKLNNYQINYINLNDNNAIEIPSQTQQTNSSTENNLLNKLIDKIKKYFS